MAEGRPSREDRGVLDRAARPPDAVLRWGSGAPDVAEVWLPNGPGRRGPAPLVLVLHGGFWRSDHDRTHLGPMAEALAAAGWAVALPEYRRVGRTGGGWPATFDDVAAATTRLPGLVDQVAPGRVDRLGVVLAGHSAGGHLALWAAGTAAARPPGLVRVVGLAPVADLATAYRLDLDDGAVADLLGGGPEAVPQRYAAADPLSLPSPPVPVTLVHGTADTLVPPEQSTAYAAGHGARLVVLAGAGHFALVDPLSAAWPAVLAALAGDHHTASHGHP